MPKKGVQKTSQTSSTNKEKIILENSVALQKVVISLSGKVSELTTQISRLLELFESSAKAIAGKDFHLPKGIDETKINSKLDNIIDQNKTIAKGLSMLHEKETQRAPQHIQPNQNYQRMPIDNLPKLSSTSTINKDLSRSPYPKKL